MVQERTARPSIRYGAGAAFTKAAAEFRAVQLEIVAQDIEQRCLCIGFYEVRCCR